MFSSEFEGQEQKLTDITRLSHDMAGLIEQKWSTHLDSFRTAFADKVSPLLEGNSGWAHFEYMYADPSTDEVRTKEALLILLPSEGTHSKAAGAPPLIKIITNETYDVDGMTQCMSEDIMIDDTNDAIILVDARILKSPDPADLEAKSFAQAFIVPQDNRLLFANFELVPSALRVSVLDCPYPAVVPFGTHSSRIDGEYALQKAWQILGDVWDEHPKHVGL